MTYLASNQDRLQAFCDHTGYGKRELMDNLEQPVFQGFLLDFALSDESLLLAFCADTGLKPEEVVRARRNLPGFSE